MSSLTRYRRKRDFAKTSEPRGRRHAHASRKPLRFVVQKHDASHLHYDLRLEVDGVMKSWAVPKGPSLNPTVRRLAMEVEDHPIEYNDFEGTIPEGEYGGGTVMIWDRGSYTADEKRPREKDETAIRRGYEEGKISFTLHGERLKGSFALVRTRGAGERQQWLLIKHRDDEAGTGKEITGKETTSVTTGRSMDEIAAGEGGSRVWHSNRGEEGKKESGKRSGVAGKRRADLRPMLARAGVPVTDPDAYTYEPKYDGIRMLAFAAPDGVALITRNGNAKTKQFPEVAAALADLVEELGQSVVLDGELVGLQGRKIVRFESLQGRMHLTQAGRIEALAKKQPAALVVFDVLVAGDEVMIRDEWLDRRAKLEALLKGRTTRHVRLGETSRDRAAMEKRARRGQWEGLIAKRLDSPYRPGERPSYWVKLKLEGTQEFVVGGWTEPRRTRKHLGSILLGYYRDGDFVYAGHTGTGFNAASLNEMERRLRPLVRKTSPFVQEPRTNEPAHWVRPKVVVQVRFNEWTTKGVVRQPVFVGFRDDKEPRAVVREPSAQAAEGKPPRAGRSPAKAESKAPRARTSPAKASPGGKPASRAPAGKRKRKTPNRVAERIRALEEEATVDLGKGEKLALTNPDKVFFPKVGITKGELLAYYAEMADYILPWMEDRPLILKRYPNGVEGKAFFQQAAPKDVPDGVRVEKVKGGRRLVGGNLATLLYTIQLGAISYDPWHSRIGHFDAADYTVLDLDPGPGVSFSQIVQVALWVKEEMDALKLEGALKTSGSRGMHIYIPLPPATPLEAATLVAQIIATRVAQRHPKEASVERTVRKRPKGSVYVDYLQNILGKSVAGVYAVRAKPLATVSTPLDWSELVEDLDPTAFTVKSVPERVREVGDLWKSAMRRRNSLARLLAGEA